MECMVWILARGRAIRKRLERENRKKGLSVLEPTRHLENTCQLTKSRFIGQSHQISTRHGMYQARSVGLGRNNTPLWSITILNTE
jgi:hypothetical protein